LHASKWGDKTRKNNKKTDILKRFFSHNEKNSYNEKGIIFFRQLF